MSFTCGVGGLPDGLPDAGDGMCCVGAAEYGPDGCTCWEPVVTLDPRPVLPVHDPVPRPTPCADCAFRPDSPERNGDDRYDHATEDDLRDLVFGSKPFFCHDGMQRVAAFVHPSGVTHPMDTDMYRPPIADGVPYRADGLPAFVCAGWYARHAIAVGAIDG
jgi:hypothetical protein